MKFPYMALIKKEHHREAGKWCNEQWGARWCPVDNRNGVWCMFWNGNYYDRDMDDPSNGKYRVHFKTEEQYVFFTLRWV